MIMSNSVSIQEESPCGKMYVIIDKNDDGDVVRIGITTKGKNGTCVKLIANMIGNLFNRKIEMHNLKKKYIKGYNGTNEYLIEQCIGILNNEACDKMKGHTSKTGVMTYSCLDAIAHALKNY